MAGLLLYRRARSNRANLGPARAACRRAGASRRRPRNATLPALCQVGARKAVSPAPVNVTGTVASQMITPLARTHDGDPDASAMRPARATANPRYPTRRAQTAILQCPLRLNSGGSSMPAIVPSHGLCDWRRPRKSFGGPFPQAARKAVEMWIIELCANCELFPLEAVPEVLHRPAGLSRFTTAPSTGRK